MNNVEFNFVPVSPVVVIEPPALIRAVKHLAAVKFPMRPPRATREKPAATPRTSPRLLVFVDGPRRETRALFPCLEFRRLEDEGGKRKGGKKKREKGRMSDRWIVGGRKERETEGGKEFPSRQALSD